MSGIAGIYSLDGRQILPEELTAFIHVLSHRGIDRSACHLAGHVGFIHCMLHTTQESLDECLPFADPATGLVITADARLDNRQDLLDELAVCSERARLIPDSHLILEAYKKWGDQCAGRLIGDFAFAVWDSQKQQLFCARDHMGTKPFYYFHSKTLFIFGSEIKAILKSHEVPLIVNEQRILDYLVFYNSDQSSTFYRNIHRLPARHTLRVTPSSIRVEPYWDFSPEKEIRFKRDEDYADAFREHFARAVACRLRSAYPIGSFLSGGLDSSSIACVASRQMQHMGVGPLITFSEVFDSLPEHVSPKSDERVFMDAAIRQCNSEALFLHFNEHGPLRNIDFQSFDEPMPYFNGYLLDETCRTARQRGVRVLLDGTDGDTTVSHGYERIYQLGTQFKLLTLYKESKEYCKLNQLQFSPKAMLWKYCIRPSLPDWLVKTANRMILRRQGNSYGAFLRPDIVSHIDWDERAEQLGKKESYCRKGRLPQYWSFISPFQQYAMEFIDTRHAHFPVEIRYPFWDRRLMEFCLGLPLEQKMRNGITRFILRNAMKGILPLEVEHRLSKADLSPQFIKDFAGTAKPFIERLLDGKSGIQQYLRPGCVEESWNRFQHDPYCNPDKAIDLYIFITLDTWLKKIHKKDYQKSHPTI